MIKMTYGQLSNHNFVQAFQKLSNAPMNMKTAYAIKKIADALTRQKNIIADEFTKEVMEKFAERDEAGNVKKPDDEVGAFSVPEARREEFVAAHEAFGKKEFTIERNPVSASTLEIKLSASEVSLLEPLLTDLEGV